MQFLKTVFKFYINSSIHVALAVYALLKITEIYCKIPVNQNLNSFIFFGTITGYNFVKYAGVAKLHHKSLTDSLKVIQVFSFLAFLAMCYFAYQVPLTTLYCTIPFIILTFLYAVPFLSGFDKNLREISYLKIVIVALVWAGFTVLIPIVDAGLELTFKTYVLLLQRFLIVAVLILPFDIRDMQYDAISLQTIPQKIGLKKTKKLGLIIMIFCLILEYLISTTNSMQMPFMVFFVLVILLLMRAKTKQSQYYSSFFVESLPIIWWFIHLGYYNI
jgi:hypothetical protein